jgi:phosphoadenosine phosphosulfate reductase
MEMSDPKIDAARKVIAGQLAAGGPPCITSSFQSEDMVVVHMVLAERPGIPVLFLETGYHFPETLVYRDQMAEEWKLNLVNLSAQQSVAEQEAQFGILNQTAPDQCCKLRKVGPLFAGLADYDVWFTGLRREQSPTRAHLQPVEPFKLPSGKTLAKISPVFDWTTRDVWQYMQKFSIPELPLYALGYTSIGCAPCTKPPLDPNDPRSGRWAGQGKLECGIHIQAE